MRKLLSVLAVGLALLAGWVYSPTAARAAGAVVVQNFADLDPTDGKNAGTFQDTNGSKIAIAVKGTAPKNYLVINYTLAQGGYCGLWCRAGGKDWAGVNLATAKTLTLTIYCKVPVVLGLALKDKNKNQYVAETPSTKGGSWETVSVSLDSFNLDPYYTPPDAIKGAPKDFSAISTFNIQPKSVGTFSVAVNNIVAQ